MTAKKSDQFEQSMKRLQEVVEKLEKGDLSLEEAMDCFSEGMQLAHFCHKKLEEAENRVRMLIKDQQGDWSTSAFEGPAESQDPNDAG